MDNPEDIDIRPNPEEEMLATVKVAMQALIKYQVKISKKLYKSTKKRRIMTRTARINKLISKMSYNFSKIEKTINR